MIFIYSQSSIHHLSGLLRTNMMTSLQLAFLWLMFGALNLRWKGAGLSSGRDSLFYSAWELGVNFLILKITDMIGWKLNNLR